MKVLLISPPCYTEGFHTLRDEICFQDVLYVPFPIRLGTIAGLLKSDHDVTVIDANAMGYDWDELERRIPEADIVFIESASGLLAHDLKVFQLVRKKLGERVKTVLVENIVAPVFPQRLLSDFPDLDFIVCGQPEVVVRLWNGHWDSPESVPGLAFRGSDGAAVVNPPAPVPEDLDGYPYMNYEAFPMDRYSISYLAAPMYEKVIPGIRFRTTRDCPYGCPFCIIQPSEIRGYGRRSLQMSPGRAVDEIEQAAGKYHLQGIFFWDETFTISQKRAMAICDEMIARKMKITWRCLTRVDALSRPLLERMHEAGCRHIEFGLESGDQAVRTQLQKKFPDEKAVEVIRWTREAGISANCDFIIGMPWETPETLQKTVSLAEKLLADNVHLTMAFPYPDTEFFRLAKRENLLLHEDLYPFMVNQRVRVGAKPWIRSRSLSDEELLDGWQRAREAINRHYFFHRVLLSPSAWWRYLKLCRNPADFARLAHRAARSVRKQFRPGNGGGPSANDGS